MISQTLIDNDHLLSRIALKQFQPLQNLVDFLSSLFCLLMFCATK